MYSLPVRLRSRIVRLYTAGRDSRPFLSQAALRLLADCSIRHLQSLDKSQLKLVENAKVVYVYSDQLHEFLHLDKKYIRNKTILSGSTDTVFNESFLIQEQKYKRIYIQNSGISDGETIITLPIGLEDYSLALHGLKSNVRVRTPFAQKLEQILVGPFSNTDHSRANLIRRTESHVHVKQIENLISPKKYARIADIFKFIACPRGRGLDTHRLWETLYRNSIPIVIKDSWSLSLLAMGYPLVLIDEWNELSNLDLHEYANKFSFSAKELRILWFEHWQREIRP